MAWKVYITNNIAFVQVIHCMEVYITDNIAFVLDIHGMESVHY